MSERGLDVSEQNASGLRFLALHGCVTAAICLLYVGLLAFTKNHLAAQWLLMAALFIAWFFCRKARLTLAVGALSVAMVVSTALYLHGERFSSIAFCQAVLLAMIGGYLWRRRDNWPRGSKKAWCLTSLEVVCVALVAITTLVCTGH